MSSNTHEKPSNEMENDTDVAIRVSNLSKFFQIYERPEDRLKQSIFPRLQSLFGRKRKEYHRNFKAIEDISFEVKRGETLGIVGRNGAGKSTLLQLICGTLQPTSGTVETNGRVAALLELGSGFNPEFSGRDNVYMNAAVLGLTHDEIDAKYDEIIAFADIGDFLDQPVKTYSSGMQVRLAFSVIAHVDAEILIIDEALAVGDAFFTQKCMRFLHEFMKTGTILLVSHDTGAVLNLCNKAIFLESGTIAMSGVPKNVIEVYLENHFKATNENDEHLETDEKPEVRINVDQQPVKVSKRDMRLDFINQTTLRNDIELFPFSAASNHFGKGGAKIVDVKILDENNDVLVWAVGGELVKLVIDCVTKEYIYNPIIGFQVKDRLGQVIFSDNTYIALREKPIGLDAQSKVQAKFEFYMPVLPTGDYSISPAIAAGTQEEHIQHHWIHDAMILKVHSSSVCLGLVGVAMENIEINI